MKKQIRSFLFILVLVAALVGGSFNGPALAKPYAVNYNLSGVLTVEKGIVRLNTEDGRVYQLLMRERKARKFDDKIVTVQGKAGKSDDVETIKVKKITEISETELNKEEPAYEAYQVAPALVGENEGKLKVENVRWDISQDSTSKETKAVHGWETATIDPEKVVKAYFVLKPFAPKFIAAHSLFVFTFDAGGMVSESGKESKALALSIEAHKKIGQTYGLIKTMKKSFNIVWLLTTWENYANLNVNFNKSSDTEIMAYPMNLTQEQTKKLLTETVRQACVNRKGEYYHTIRNNCTNNLLILLNRVTPKEKQFKLWKIPSMLYNLKATMPLSVAKQIKKKGFISEPLPTISRSNFYTDLEAKRIGK